MELIPVTDERFKEYGRIVDEIDFSELIGALKATPLSDAVEYVASCKELEALPVKDKLDSTFWGESVCQIGYCNGVNKKLNALEYHRCSEINVPAEDTVLLLGRLCEVASDYTYDTAKVQAFLVPAGVAVEIYATTLHYAPCNVGSKGFQVAVVLPKGTNEALEEDHGKKAGEDRLLAARNKWLIGHREGGLPKGTFLGLKGENITITV